VSVDEIAVKDAFRRAGRSAAECAQALAETKARRGCARHPGALVLGCDQMLVLGDDWFDKPGTQAAARAQLRALRGKTHALPTAAALARDGQILWRAVETPRLAMRDLTDAELDAYLANAGDAALGSVGAYQIEGAGAALMASVEGDRATIQGLPLKALQAWLHQAGAAA